MAVLLFFVVPVCVIGLLLVVKIFSWFYDLITEPTYTPCWIPYQQQTQPVIPTTEEVKPFSLSEYLERIENEHIKILQEKEQRTPYTIILWLNLDGLRLNDDGSFEWIQRVKKKEPEKVSITSKNDLLPMMTRNIFQAQNPYLGTSICQSLQADREQFLGYSQCCQTVQSQIRDCMCSQTRQIDSGFRNLESQMEKDLAMIYALHLPMPPAYNFGGLNYGQTAQHF